MAYLSTVLPAKEALDTLLNGWTWPEGAPTVLWGQPLITEEIRMDAVYQGSPETAEDQLLVLGASRIDESYDLVVVVDVRRWGDDEHATESRATAHYNQLVNLLMQNKTLNNTLSGGCVTGWRPTFVNGVGGPQQWRTQITVRVSVTGYVFP